MRAPVVTILAFAGLAFAGVGALALPAWAAPDNSRSIVIAYSSEPATLDPCDFESNQPLILKNNVVQSLTDLDPSTGAVTPVLATAWTRKGPTTWEFKLRHGVTYSDGTPFNATAAVFGINRDLNTSDITCTDQSKVGEKLTPTAIDDDTIQIVTDKPAPILPRELAFVDLPSPKATPPHAKTANPIGTGPYVFDKWEPGQYLAVHRRADYWGPMPDVESAKVVYRREPSVLANMVKTGEADLGLPVLEQYATTNDRTRRYPQNSTFYLRLSVQSPPFNDLRVRQAVDYAIDRKTIVEALMGRTALPSEQVVAETVNAYMPQYKGPGFDPARAKQLLAEAKQAGVPVDAHINFVGMTNQFSGSDEVLQAVTQDLQNVGFNVTLQVVDIGAWSKVLFKPFPPNQPPTILSVKNRNVTGDASSTFTSYIDAAGCCSTANNPTMNALIDAARQIDDPAARGAAWQKAALEEYTTDLSLIPVAELYQLLMLSPRIDYQPTGQTEVMQLPLRDIHFR
jgi:peptide/nickel transport system substrate-binding protein